MYTTDPSSREYPEDILRPLSVGGVPVVPFKTYDHALQYIEESLEAGRKSFWVAMNPIKIYRAWHEPALMGLLRKTSVNICDGVGVSVASRIFYGRSMNRITGCDLFYRLLSLASRKRWGIYLLGASPESNAAARSRLQKRYPDLRIVGWQDGYFENPNKVIENINASKADLLFVAMGSPKQEYWINSYRNDINATFCMGVGGSFDVAAGKIRRAPRFFRATGTEFLFRFIVEPRKRLANQVILAQFLFRIIEKRVAGSYDLKSWNTEPMRR
jgi:N-acetylglucosaminyldiphosphoundecaprenol N-acetyl-beta-D-mannosaminyltransferase